MKLGSKIVLLNSNTLTGFTKVSCIIFMMRNKEPHYLLNSRRTNSFNISLFVVFIILIRQYVAWQRWISLKSQNNIFLPLSNIRLNTNLLQSKSKLTFSQIVNVYMYIIMKHTLPRLFINKISSICITAATTFQQLHVTRINFNS